MKSNTIRKFRWIAFLPYSIIFNLKYLSFKKAVKLPIIFYVRPKFLQLSGHVKIENQIKTGMIKLGIDIAPIESYAKFRWQNAGTVIFKGACIISHHTFISCSNTGIIEFGNNSSYSYGLKIIACEKILFGNKARISWNCTFIDTDFHPIIDLSCNKKMSITSPISIGYAGWIGHDSIISKGSRIPDNTIVASGSIVKRKFNKTNTIIGGNPAIVMDDGYQRDDV